VFMTLDDAPAREISARKSYVVVFLCWLAIFAEGYDVGVLGAVLPALSNDPQWRLTPLQLGAMGSYTVFGMLIGGILAGMLSETYGRKPLFILCLVLFASCMILSALAPTPAVFGFSRFVAGLGLGGIIPCAAALTTEFSPKSRKSFNYGLMYSGYSIGILTAALVSRAHLEDHGWRMMMLIGAAPLALVPVMMALLPESLEWLVSRGRTARAESLARRWNMAVPTPAARRQGLRWREVLGRIFARERARETACFWSALFMGLMLVYGLGQWLPQIMRKSGYDLGNSLLFLAVFSLSSAIGGIFLGKLADRFGVRFTVAASYLLGAVGIFALSFQNSLVVNHVFVALAGFGTVAASLILTGFLAQRLSPEVRAAGTGWALSFSRLGALSGPLLGGALASTALPVAANFHVFAGVAVLAAVATALIPPERA